MGSVRCVGVPSSSLQASAQQPSSYVASVSAGTREHSEHWDGDGEITVIRTTANTSWTLEQEPREQGHRQHVFS